MKYGLDYVVLHWFALLLTGLMWRSCIVSIYKLHYLLPNEILLLRLVSAVGSR